MAQEPYEPEATLEEKQEAIRWALQQLDLRMCEALKRNKYVGPKAAEVVVRSYKVHSRALRQMLVGLREGG